MKNLATFLLIWLFIGCGSDTSSPISEDENTGNSTSTPSSSDDSSSAVINTVSTKFLSFYTPSFDTDTKGLKVLTLDTQDSLLEGSVGNTFYPPQRYGGAYDFLANATTYGNFYAMALHKDFHIDTEGNSSYPGIVGYFNSQTYEYLPLVNVSESSDYKYFVGGTAKISRSGHIVYLSATNDKSYGDEYRPHIVRYNTQNKTHDIAISCDAFIFAQPEKGEDTEKCQVNTYILPSLDARYVYGYADAYGTEGGGIHWDYKILFKYDFNTKTYTRLGEEGDTGVSLIGLTSDEKYMIYSKGSQVKIQNLETNRVNNINNITHSAVRSPSLWNEKGMLSSSTVQLYYVNFLNDTETVVVPKRVTNEQLSEDGKSVYFLLYDDPERILYKTEDLSENSPYKKVGKIPKEYGSILIIKNNTSKITNNTTVIVDDNAGVDETDTTNDVIVGNNGVTKSCIENEGFDEDVFWTTCYDEFPENECSLSKLGQEADELYTHSYKVVEGTCFDNFYREEDIYLDKEYHGNIYNSYILFL